MDLKLRKLSDFITCKNSYYVREDVSINAVAQQSDLQHKCYEFDSYYENYICCAKIPNTLLII